MDIYLAEEIPYLSLEFEDGRSEGVSQRFGRLSAKFGDFAVRGVLNLDT